jgi:hypothetical protein
MFLSADEIDETLEYTPSNGSPSARRSMPLFTSSPAHHPPLPHLILTAANILRKYTIVDIQDAAHSFDERHGGV